MLFTFIIRCSCLMVLVLHTTVFSLNHDVSSKKAFQYDRSIIAYALAQQHFMDGMKHLYSIIAASLFYDDISVGSQRIAGLDRQYLVDSTVIDLFYEAVNNLPSLSNNSAAVEYGAQQLKKAISSFHRSNLLFPTIMGLEHSNWIFSLLGKNDFVDNASDQFPHDEATKQVRNRVRGLIDESAKLINIGAYQEALNIYDHIMKELHIEYFEVYFNLAVLQSRKGNILDAIDAYETAISIHPLHTKSILNLGTIYQQCSQFSLAIERYQTIIFIRKVADILTGEQGYTFMSDFYIDARSNLALTLFQQRQYLEGLNQASKVLNELYDFRKTVAAMGQTNELDSVDQHIHAVEGISLLIRRSSLLWEDFEVLRDTVTKATLRNVGLILDHYTKYFILSTPRTDLERAQALSMKSLQIGPMLPFDTMLYGLPLDQRLIVAKATSIYYYKQYESITVVRSTRKKIQNSLKIGLISYDFNDHPTTHLIEGIFKYIREFRTNHIETVKASYYQQIVLYVYAYGADDQSYFRKMLETTSDYFFDIVGLSHFEAFDLIHNQHQIDALFDMQIHTLGNRLELTALRPAPVIINYLVFPGTSGSTFFDYVVADRIVVPAEAALFYTERLLYLPPTYQVSYYSEDIFALRFPTDLSVSADKTISHSTMTFEFLRDAIFDRRNQLRVKYGLPNSDGREIIFCNFNKLDKFEPQSFMVWMQVMAMVPNSFLWMLKPSPHIGQNESEFGKSTNVMIAAIYLSAAAMGISKRRIIFAERVSKKEHIERHSAADLFLDTFSYGAHSTATDALRGGLPILTLRGESFPERVGSSLYHSFESTPFAFSHHMLTVDSIKEFVETAVRLVSTPQEKAFKTILLNLKVALWNAVSREHGLFKGKSHVAALISASAAMEELESIRYELSSSNTTPTIVNNAIAREEVYFNQEKWNIIVGTAHQ